MKKILIAIVLISSIGCQTAKKEKNTESTTSTVENTPPVVAETHTEEATLTIAEQFVKNIETAHKKEAFLQHPVVSFSIALNFGGTEVLQAKITMLTNSSKIRIDKKDTSKLIFDGTQMYLCPVDASEKGARFDMFTWTYFFGLPYKLDDPGTIWEVQADRPLDEKAHATAKLSFAAGTGDAPDDWYVIYKEPNSNLLKAAAYIVTYGNTGDITKAEADPHAIKYTNFTTVDNIPFATTWEFYGWTIDQGMTKKLGEATISDITFLNSAGDLFDRPENAKIIP